MTYLVAVLVPPLYFLIKKKWLALIASLVAVFFAVIFAMMVVLLPISFILWGLFSVIAVWDLRKRLVHENAEILATKMAEKMREAQTPPVVLPKK